jgi:hypothetical protein
MILITAVISYGGPLSLFLQGALFTVKVFQSTLLICLPFTRFRLAIPFFSGSPFTAMEFLITKAD